MKHVIHPSLVRAIDESFELFLRQHAFRWVPNDLTGWGANRVAIYDGPEYRLIFELDAANKITVVARALDDRLHGGALAFLLPFLSGSKNKDVISLRTQAENLQHHHAAIADLLCGRDEERYREFVQWVEVNWKRLTNPQNDDALPERP